VPWAAGLRNANGGKAAQRKPTRVRAASVGGNTFLAFDQGGMSANRLHGFERFILQNSFGC
jgi:hypothetical protein